MVFFEVAARIDSEALHAALDAIPEEFARAVELHDIEGFKYQEIAEIEGVALGTVMSRISRGRRLIGLAGAIEAAAGWLGQRMPFRSRRRAPGSEANNE